MNINTGAAVIIVMVVIFGLAAAIGWFAAWVSEKANSTDFSNAKPYKGKNTEKKTEAVYYWSHGTLWKDDNGNFCLYHPDGISHPVAKNSIGRNTGRTDITGLGDSVFENDIISFKHWLQTYVGKVVCTKDGMFEVLYATADNEELKRIQLSKVYGIEIIGNGYNDLSAEEMRREVALGREIYMAKREGLLRYNGTRYGYSCPRNDRRYSFCLNAYQEGTCNNCSSVYCHFNPKRADEFIVNEEA